MSHLLILLTKYPEPWKVKTRLARDIGNAPASRIQERFIEKILENHSHTPQKYELIIGLRWGENIDRFAHRFRVNTEDIFVQKWDDLWGIMSHAVAHGLLSHEKVFLIGSDIPLLSPGTFTEAFDMLDRTDIVLGPSNDGGYYAIGMKRPHTSLFEDIVYSTETVLQETIGKCQANSLDYRLLAEQIDIDTLDDLKKAAARDTTGFLSRLLQEAHANNISIIIPCYRESNETLQNIIDDINGKFPRAEIIISDGSYNPETRQALAGMKNVRYIENSARIRSGGLNTGAKAASGDILLFLHADTILPENAYRILSDLDTTKYIYGWFYKKFDHENIWLSLNAFFSNLRLKLLGSLLGDNAMFVSRELFDMLWGFPEISLMEDVEFSAMLRKHRRRKVVRAPIITSARRFLRWGILRTILFMQYMRLLHFWWCDPDVLERKYRNFGKM